MEWGNSERLPSDITEIERQISPERRRQEDMMLLERCRNYEKLCNSGENLMALQRWRNYHNGHRGRTWRQNSMWKPFQAWRNYEMRHNSGENVMALKRWRYYEKPQNSVGDFTNTNYHNGDRGRTWRQNSMLKREISMWNRLIKNSNLNAGNFPMDLGGNSDGVESKMMRETSMSFGIEEKKVVEDGGNCELNPEKLEKREVIDGRGDPIRQIDTGGLECFPKFNKFELVKSNRDSFKNVAMTSGVILAANSAAMISLGIADIKAIDIPFWIASTSSFMFSSLVLVFSAVAPSILNLTKAKIQIAFAGFLTAFSYLAFVATKLWPVSKGTVIALFLVGVVAVMITFLPSTMKIKRPAPPVHGDNNV